MSDRNIYSSSNDDYGDGFYDGESENIQYEEQDKIPVNYPPPQKKKKGTFGKIIRTLFVLFAILLVVTGVYLIVVLSRVNYSADTPDHSVSENDGITLKSEDGIENILLFGEDNHTEGENGRADSIILLTVDKNHNLLKQTSFMRDIYLYIPGYYYSKLNAAYSLGGPKLAAETIEYNFGIKIDDYIIIDFNSFTDIVDSVGGVDLELTYDEIEYINWQSYRNKQVDTETELDPDSYEYEYNKNDDYVAIVHLNGRQALWYARDRDSAGSDFDRTQRQRTVINTIFSKLKGSDPITLMRTIYSASEYLTTNMNGIDLSGKGIELMFALKYDRKEYRIPSGDNYYDVWNESGQALQIDDEDLERERLYNFVFGNTEE